MSSTQVKNICYTNLLVPHEQDPARVHKCISPEMYMTTIQGLKLLATAIEYHRQLDEGIKNLKYLLREAKVLEE